MQHPYVVAFNRDRDFYQLAAALAEAGKLQTLVTDLYLPDILANSKLSRALGIEHRHCTHVPSRQVEWSLRAIWLQMASLRQAKSARQRSKVFNNIDSHLSRKAGRTALRSNANLFLYSGYALEAFEMAQKTNISRLLFVYHPQGDYVRTLLEEDYRLHPEVSASHKRHLDEIEVNEGDRVAREIALSSAVVCASSFTAASVRSCLAGRNRDIAVAPYGCFPSVDQAKVDDERRQKPQVLFVGQGTQRKGLHHLLKVWRSGFHHMADLTLVVNQMDPGIITLSDALPSPPRMMSNLTHKELENEFQKADIFVLPSLVEGFGLVYLEALAAGCHVIGTTNTGLPDLLATPETATIIPAGNLESLRAALESAIHLAANKGFDRAAIKSFAATRSWQAFRKNICNFVEDTENKSFNR